MTDADTTDFDDPALREALEDEVGDGLENRRLRFFFENQALIAEWYQLANEAWTEVERSLRDLASEFDDGRAGQAGFLVASTLPGFEPQGPVLYREAWCLGGTEPQIGFVLGWFRRVDPSGTWPASTRPYYGILTAKTEAGARLRELIMPAVLSRLSIKDPRVARFVKGSQWATYRPIESAPDWWKAVATWRSGIADDMLAAAGAWTAEIDDAVRSHMSLRNGVETQPT